jgi:hypothetical protein
MTFTAPLFLLATIAAAIPVVLHMINRRKAKQLPFSTLRFLRVSAQKTRRRKRIHDVLLMAIRAALLTLIAVALARPAITSLGSLWGGSHSAVVIVLDNSASMGLVDKDNTRFDTATAAAAQILDQFIDGDQIAFLVVCGPAFPEGEKLERTQDNARRILAQCRASYEKADLTKCVDRARELLKHSDAPNKQIYVITDMQEVSWKGGRRGVVDEGRIGKDGGGKVEDRTDVLSLKENESTNEPASPVPRHVPLPPVILVNCNRTPKPNVAVEAVALDASAPVAGVPMRATATLLNASTVARQPRVELWVDGSREAGSPELNIGPDGRAKHTFSFAFRGGGVHRGEVRLVDEDGSAFDDRRYFTMEVDRRVPVAIVRAKQHEIAYLDDAYYLERALSSGNDGGWAIRPTLLTSGDLLSESFEKYKVVFCVNLPAIGSDVAERLRNYVAGGGNVVWFAGDHVDPAAYNEMNENTGVPLLPASLSDVRAVHPNEHRDSWHIGFLDKNDPAIGALVEPAGLYESVLVYRHVGMKVDANAKDVKVLARLDDGEPLLTSREVEKGRVLMFGISARTDWSNLPLRPIFLPLAARLTFELADVEQGYHSVIAGQPLVLTFPDRTSPIGVEVVPPSGETLRLKTTGVEGQSGQMFLYKDTHQIGVYLVRTLDAANSRSVPFAVNFDPEEAEPASIDRKTLEEQLGGMPVVLAENPDDLSDTFALLREGKSLWGAFLWLVLAGLVFETLVSNRLSPKLPD